MSPRRKPILWITDPWDTLDHARDTTLRLAGECLKREIPVSWCDVRSIRAEGGRIRLDAAPLLEIPHLAGPDAIRRGPTLARMPGEFHSLHYRTDPPVDLAYLQPLQLLALGAEKKAPLVNPARVLLMLNEKVEGQRLGHLMPPTVAASAPEPLERFGRAEGRAVLKPFHEAQSKGVELLDWRTREGAQRARAALAAATREYTHPVVLQRFLPGIAEGEQRLWFLDGRLLACVRKLPKDGDFRVNIDGGSRVARTKLNRREKAVVIRISKHLKTEKIRLAAVDLIEGLITDFNFTSPGLIVAMEEVLAIDLAAPIVRAISR